ncbi:MAG: PIG-L deacetylase family protein [Thermoanaerobaculia bacterium]
MIRQPQPPGHTSAVAAVRTLVLAPHFDDEVLGCGGLVAKLAAAGATVEVLFLTDGSGGVEEIADRADYAARRRREAEDVVRLLGCASLEVAGIRDGALAQSRGEAAAAIRRRLVAGRPGLLLVPSPLEISEDHRAAFAALHDVLHSTDGSGAGQDGLAEVARGLEVWLYEVNHPGYPDLLVDVSECQALLGQAMAIYASQEERHPYLRAGIGLRQFRTHTLAPAIGLAEGYRRLAARDFVARDLASLVAEVGGSVPEVVANLDRTYSEIERLNALIREMEGTRAWRLHRWVERLRGKATSAPRSGSAVGGGHSGPRERG